MQYFRNYELANMYNVSQAAVGKWISAAKLGKLDLALVLQDGKYYVANTAKNLATIQQMVQDRKKYYNKRSYKVVSPSPLFYELYSQSQIYDIIYNLDIHREIPLQYAYFDGGVTYWDAYTTRLFSEDTPNILTGSIELLGLSHDYIDAILANYTRVNVVDIGVGTAFSAKDLLAHLLERGRLGRYVAIDISQEMLDVAKRNITAWFGDTVPFEGYIRDINYDRFVDILASETVGANGEATASIMLLMGGTLGNSRSPGAMLNVISSSMGKHDILVFTDKLDSPATRLHFDFDDSPDKTGTPRLDSQSRLLPDMLGIDDSYYDVEQLFDDVSRARIIRIRLKVALSIAFEVPNGEKVVDFHKGETILIWRAWHRSSLELIDHFEANGLSLVQASQKVQGNFLMLVTEIKHNRPISTPIVAKSSLLGSQLPDIAK